MQITIDDAVMTVTGQVDGRSTLEMRELLYGVIRSCDTDVVLDLTDVESIDVTALRMIAVASREMGEGNRCLLLRGCSPLVRRLLHLSHLRGLVRFDRAV